MGGTVPPGLGDIPGVISDAADISAKVSIFNYTNETLILIDQSGDENDSDNGRPSTGSFVNLPQPEIAPGQHDEFEYKVDHVRVGAVEVHTDAQGFVKYQVGTAAGRTWQVNFTNPLAGNAHGESLVIPATDGFSSPAPQHGGGKHAPIQAVLHQEGFDPNSPGKPPEPPAITSRSIITVTNNTQQPLTLINQGHERGGFLSFPKPLLQPGESDSFASVETQGVTDPKLQGEKGSLVYQIGPAGGATWHLDWDNPENAQNTCAAIVQGAPEGVVFQSLGQIGEGEDNVPVAFTLSGGGGGGTPEHEVEWAPPQEAAGEPTLRSTDDNPDGWVEYAQELLNNHGANLAVDGNFGPGTLAAVRHLQTQFNIQQDGVIGNQTWAVLRGEHPAPAGTDGRSPHSFEETGPQARWLAEGSGGTHYDPATDLLQLFLVSTGEHPIDDFQATIRVIGNDAGELFTTQNPIGPPVSTNPHGGANYVIEIQGLHESYGDGVHTVEAYLPAEIGGDYTTFQVRVGNV